MVIIQYPQADIFIRYCADSHSPVGARPDVALPVFLDIVNKEVGQTLFFIQPEQAILCKIIQPIVQRRKPQVSFLIKKNVRYLLGSRSFGRFKRVYFIFFQERQPAVFMAYPESPQRILSQGRHIFIRQFVGKREVAIIDSIKSEKSLVGTHPDEACLVLKDDINLNRFIFLKQIILLKKRNLSHCGLDEQKVKAKYSKSSLHDTITFGAQATI